MKPVKGMRDIIFDEAEKLVYIINVARNISSKFGYKEAILPTIEYYSLFAEKSGYEINKRMYVFEDLSGRKLALRPELTPSVARLFINSLQSLPRPIRISYFANVFRYDEPQRARYREFWQAGFEHLGSSSYLADLEVISLALEIFKALDLEKVKIKLGSMSLIRLLLNKAGVDRKDLPYFFYLIDKKEQDLLKKELSKYEKGLEAYEKLIQLSELKGFDEIEANALEIIGSEGAEDLKNFLHLAKLISKMNENLEINLSFARGIEYYTGVIYEFFHQSLDLSIGGGGRYDLLIEYYGGPKTPATGCALGLDRISLIFKPSKIDKKKSIMLYLIEKDEESELKAFKISSMLRNEDFIVSIDTSSKDLSDSLSKASKLDFDYFIIIGKEAKEGKISLRDMKKREQLLIEESKLLDWISSNK